MGVERLPKCVDVIIDLKKEINRLSEERDNIETINKSHKNINGTLRLENTDLRNQIEKLKKEIENYKDPLNELRENGDL